MDALTIRASSLPELLDCAARWEARHLLGMHMASGPEALVGTAVHAGAAAYDLAVIAQARIKPSEAADVARERVLNPTDEVDWSGGGYDRGTAVTAAGIMTALYIDQVGQHSTFVEVEVKAQPLTIEVGGVAVTFTGNIDRIIEDPALGRWPADLKTGKKFRAAGQHRAQLAVYDVLDLVARATPGLGVTAGPEVIAIQLEPPAVERTFLRNDSLRYLVGAEGDPGVLHHIAAVAKAEVFVGNAKSTLCSGKYCPRFPTCKWR